MGLKVVIACGGTGGHLFPGIAVAEELERRGHEVLSLISEKNIDALATEGYRHLKFETVEAIAMPPLLSPAMLKFLVKFIKTRTRCRRLVRDFGADAVLGMGGFTSMPPVMAGRSFGAKTFVHESNAFPGKANRLTAKFCDAVLLGFEACAAHFSGRRTEVVGTPVRTDLDVGMDAGEARVGFGLKAGVPTVLVMGGSQGARGVNRAVCDALKHLGGAGVQFLHFTGAADEVEVSEAYAGSGVDFHVAPFCQEMGKAYAAATLAIARSGASSLAELAAFGVPSVLVPYPYAADDHQSKNAAIFGDVEAALVIDEEVLDGVMLGKVIGEFSGDPRRTAEMAEHCRALAVPGAAAAICEKIEAACGKR